MKKIIFVLFSLLFFQGIIFSQGNDAPGKPRGDQIKPNNSEKAGTKNDKKKTTDAIQQYYKTNPQDVNTQQGGAAPTQNSPASPGFWGPMIFLLVVVGVLYFILRYIRKKKAPPISEIDFFQSLGTLSLSGGTYLEIVEIGEKIYLLGVGSASVNMLMEVEDKDLILKLKSRPTSPKHKSFVDILSNVFERKGKNIKIENPQKNFTDFLKQQKDRLKKLK